jgi:sugar (pentulose or hexulose) kinase
LESFDVTVSSVRLVGGGSKNKLWQQIVADVMRQSVTIPDVAESAALGAALQAAAVASGADIADFVRQHRPASCAVVDPVTEHASIYEEALLRHKRLGEALFSHPLDSAVW